MIRRVQGPGMSAVAGLTLTGVGGSCPAGAAGNGLLNALIAYWPGNEINGNALDLHTNALHLTDVNTVTSNPGIVYALARQYTAATSERHTRPGDDALLSVSDLDFTLACWVRFDTFVTSRPIVGKFGAAGDYGYRLFYTLGANRLIFQVSSDGTAVVTQTATTLGAPATGIWYFLIGWHDSVANTVNIQVNGGAVDSTAYILGAFNNANPFKIGEYDATVFMNGRIGPTMFWKSNAGLGGVLTAAQRIALFNGGVGLTYAQFTL